jgi:hypothetical protein
MPVDQKIRRLAADPEVVAAIKIIDCVFNNVAKGRDIDMALAGVVTAEELIEDYWRLMKRGILCLDDDGDDDDAPVIREANTPAEQARARLIGGKLFAVRQYLRRTKAARGTPT